MELLECLIVLFVLSVAITGSQNNVYSNTWAVHITNGETTANNLARKYGFRNLGQIMPDIFLFEHPRLTRRSVLPSLEHHESLSGERDVLWLEQQVVKRRVKRNVVFNDPNWGQTWYLTRDDRTMGVKGAWEMGVTGRGAVVTILDDGIEKNHPDLAKNYDAEASYDVNDHDNDPQPRYDPSNENRHGTRCAGEVAAEANNSICSVGIAFDAKIGGVRMLDGDVTDAVEAQSLSLNPQHIDIYSASWGPDDDGRTVDGPGPLARKAFQDGIDKGRRGLGSIFVWASGNGGRDADNCNCDGYTNSVFTLSISSATEAGNIPWYSEACASTLATTYSSGGGGERQIVTTDLRLGCTEAHTGTSASAPLAAAMCALALEANPQLTWRDMQFIVMLTARPDGLNAADWITNAVGRRVSHSFGYGMMNAEGMVTLARSWAGLPEQHRCDIVSSDKDREVVGTLQSRVTSDGCSGTPNEVVYLEHVQVLLTLSSGRRGEVEIYLTSPMGTRSMLLARRPRDVSTDGFKEWVFMTTHSWSELSVGEWILELKNGASSATLHSWTLIVYGTVTNPLTTAPPPSQGASTSVSPPQPDCQPTEVRFDGQCVTSCPDKYYLAERLLDVANASTNITTMTTSRSCVRCDIVCETCVAPHGDCLICRAGFDLRNGSCQLHVVPSHSALATKTTNSNDSLLLLLMHSDRSAFIIAMISCIGLLVMLVIVFIVLQACDRASFGCARCDPVEGMENGKDDRKRLIGDDNASSDEEEESPIE